MTAVTDVIQKGAHQLGAIAENPLREARLLLAHLLKIPYEEIYFSPPYKIDPEQEHAFNRLIARRLSHEPISRITGVREFWSLPFKVTPDTLDPRPDSETLVEAVLRCHPEKHHPLRIIDLGTGTGCLLLSLLHEYPQAWGVGVDIGEKTCQVAQENALELGLYNRSAFITGNWGQAIYSAFDIIICNPPYISTLETLPPEVAHHDPAQALYAEEDGLTCYRELARNIGKLAKAGTRFFLEIGAGQKTAVNQVFGHVPQHVFQDLGGHDRCLVYCL